MLAISVLTLALATAGPSESRPELKDLDYSAVRVLAVQCSDQVSTRGRVTPLDTLARQVIKQITGRQQFGRYDSVGLLLDWSARPKVWSQQAMFKVDYRPLKTALQLEPTQSRFSYGQLSSNQELLRLSGRARDARKHDRKPSDIEQRADQVVDKLELYQSAVDGSLFRVVPYGPVSLRQAWHTPATGPDAVRDAWRGLMAATAQGDSAAFAQAAVTLRDAVRQVNPDVYPSEQVLQLECHYNRFRPFRWATYSVLLAAMGFAMSLKFRTKWLYAGSVTFLGLGFGVQTYGLVLRTIIGGRVPVANMYESLVFVCWGLLLAAVVFELVLRLRVLGLMAGVLGFAVLTLADTLPLSPHVAQLIPVLRNTVWLAVHVITILLGYSALFLAMGLGHVLLGNLVFASGRDDRIRRLTNVTNWVVDVGVLLLAAGIVFGAIWANASWGRYWGWDPKETWSLITLFGYLGMIHAVRLAGRYRSLITAAGSIAGFLLVLMTYYGVNYILGRGLHSYGGVGGGDGQWIALLFAVAELAILIAGVAAVVGSHRLSVRTIDPTPVTDQSGDTV